MTMLGYVALAHAALGILGPAWLVWTFRMWGGALFAPTIGELIFPWAIPSVCSIWILVQFWWGSFLHVAVGASAVFWTGWVLLSWLQPNTLAIFPFTVPVALLMVVTAYCLLR